MLNVGCGSHRAAAPWINVDRSLGSPLREDGFRDFPCHPDIIADVRALPFADDTVDAIYAGHVLEHIEYEQNHLALTELWRVLAPGGRLCVVGPDMDRAVGELAEFAPCIWPGMSGEWSTWPGAGHQYCPTAANTADVLRVVFPDAAEVPVGNLDGFWPITDRTGWQFSFLATKEAA